mmetsp:Transcript_15364/g.39168  ORF Transcript_15364/g.39168 Transcript_15364/m.39168 type:complete len:580 (+) Transcript_15364:339-2078(+)
MVFTLQALHSLREVTQVARVETGDARIVALQFGGDGLGQRRQEHLGGRKAVHLVPVTLAEHVREQEQQTLEDVLGVGVRVAADAVQGARLEQRRERKDRLAGVEQVAGQSAETHRRTVLAQHALTHQVLGSVAEVHGHLSTQRRAVAGQEGLREERERRAIGELLVGGVVAEDQRAQQQAGGERSVPGQTGQLRAHQTEDLVARDRVEDHVADRVETTAAGTAAHLAVHERVEADRVACEDGRAARHVHAQAERLGADHDAQMAVAEEHLHVLAVGLGETAVVYADAAIEAGHQQWIDPLSQQRGLHALKVRVVERLALARKAQVRVDGREAIVRVVALLVAHAGLLLRLLFVADAAISLAFGGLVTALLVTLDLAPVERAALLLVLAVDQHLYCLAHQLFTEVSVKVEHQRGQLLLALQLDQQRQEAVHQRAVLQVHTGVGLRLDCLQCAATELETLVTATRPLLQLGAHRCAPVTRRHLGQAEVVGEEGFGRERGQLGRVGLQRAHHLEDAQRVRRTERQIQREAVVAQPLGSDARTRMHWHEHAAAVDVAGRRIDAVKVRMQILERGRRPHVLLQM